MAEVRSVQIINGLMDMQAAADYLGIKKSTLYDLTMRRQIPMIKLGRLNKFRLQDLDAFVSQNKVS